MPASAAADRLGDGDAAVSPVLHDGAGPIAGGPRIDAAGPYRFFKDILLPLSRTNLAALFVILFIYGWNQYLWPLLITTRDDMQTIVIRIKKIVTTRTR